MFKKKYRIVEEINSDGKSRFYCERTILGIWSRYSGFEGYDMSFDSYKEANNWITYEHTASVRVHAVGKSAFDEGF